MLNMWYDADIDRVMNRTAMRPIPRGKVSRAEALASVLLLQAVQSPLLACCQREAAGLLAFAIFFYVAVYTMWLKRRTPQNIVIGGAAGALPPMIGWAAATGDVGLEPFILFLIIFLWTPPHFWALSLNRNDEYARAGIPMLPVVAGRNATAKQIFVYSLLLCRFNLPWALGFSGGDLRRSCRRLWCDLCCARGSSRRSRGTNQHAAHRLFAFSILYLFLLFAALLAKHDQSINNAVRACAATVDTIPSCFSSGPTADDAVRSG